MKIRTIYLSVTPSRKKGYKRVVFNINGKSDYHRSSEGVEKNLVWSYVKDKMHKIIYDGEF